MTDEQAAILADKIKRTWKNAADVDMWAEELLELDYPDADRCYRKLRHESENAPSIARFVATYHSVKRPELKWSRPENDGPVMSFDEYIQRQTARASEGDLEAIEALDVWEDNERRGLTVDNLLRRTPQ